MKRKVFSEGKIQSNTYHIHIKIYPKLSVLVMYCQFSHKISMLTKPDLYNCKTHILIIILKTFNRRGKHNNTFSISVKCTMVLWTRPHFRLTHLIMFINLHFKKKFYMHMIILKLLTHIVFYRDINGRKKVHFSVNLSFDIILFFMLYYIFLK